MAINCKELWREVSNYLDNSISPALRKQMEFHLLHCRRCAAIVDGVHNIVVLVADKRVYSVPAGFGDRLHARLRKEMYSSSGSAVEQVVKPKLR